MCMLQSNRWHSCSSVWINENKCSRSLFRQLTFVLTVDYLHNEVGSHLTPTFSLKNLQVSWRCVGSSRGQRFHDHGVVQGQVQQVEDQQHRRKRYRLQKVRPQGRYRRSKIQTRGVWWYRSPPSPTRGIV